MRCGGWLPWERVGGAETEDSVLDHHGDEWRVPILTVGGVM